MRKLILACLLAGASMLAVSTAASACDCYGYNAGYYGYAAPRVYAYAPAPRVYAYAPVRRVYRYAAAPRVYGYAAAPRVYAYSPAAPVYAYGPAVSVYYDPVWGWTSW